MINLDDVARNTSRHIRLCKDEWYVSLWRSEDITFNPRKLNEQLEKISLERLQDHINGKHTTVSPKKEEYVDNVILNIALQESIDRDIGVSSTTLNWNSLGTSATAEVITQTDLVAELTDTAYARKQFSTAGTRGRTGQSAILAMLWDDTSLDSTPTTIREAGIHWHLSDSSKCHARAVFSDFSFDAGDTFIVRATELQQNGSL